MTTRRGTATADRQIMWAGDVQAGQLAWAWKDVGCARGKDSDAPATRFVRMSLTATQLGLCCFCPDLLLYTHLATSNVTSATEDEAQIAVDDPTKSLADLVRGMSKSGGVAHIELGAATQGDVREMFAADMLTVTWEKFSVSLPVVEVAPANWGALDALRARLSPEKRKRVADFGLGPGANKRLGATGKFINFRYNGDGIPFSLIAGEDLKGYILEGTTDVKGPDNSDETKAARDEAYRFLDLLRKPIKENADEMVNDPDGFEDVPIDGMPEDAGVADPPAIPAEEWGDD